MGDDVYSVQLYYQRGEGADMERDFVENEEDEEDFEDRGTHIYMLGRTWWRQIDFEQMKEDWDNGELDFDDMNISGVYCI